MVHKFVITKKCGCRVCVHCNKTVAVCCKHDKAEVVSESKKPAVSRILGTISSVLAFRPFRARSRSPFPPDTGLASVSTGVTEGEKDLLGANRDQ